MEVFKLVLDRMIAKVDEHFPKSEMVVIKKILQYIDTNSLYLSTANIHTKPRFNDGDRDVIYAAIQILEEEIEDFMDESPTFDTKRIVSSKPFYVACMAVSNHCLKRKKPAVETCKMVLTYMSLMMYVLIHHKYVEYSANPDVMNYTINNLDDSFSIKKLGTVYAMLEDNIVTCMATYNNQIKRGSDDDIQKFIAAVHTRINSKLKNIFNKYYDNKAAGASISYSSDAATAENFELQNNETYAIIALTDKVNNALIAQRISNNAITLASLKGDISRSTADHLIKDIINEDEDRKVHEFIGAICEFYVYHLGHSVNDIARGKFIDDMTSAYASNTTATQMNIIKTILDGWLVEHANKYGKARYGKTAQASYKKFIFMFFIFTINIHAK